MRKVTTVHYEPPIRTLNGWDMRIAGEETKIEQEDCDIVNNNLMSREKQIEEMRYLADEMGKAISTGYEKRVLADERELEAVLKENGWRKASEVAREIIKDLVKFADDKERQMNFHGHSVWYINADDVTDFIAELKKKYTEEKYNG